MAQEERESAVFEEFVTLYGVLKDTDFGSYD